MTFKEIALAAGCSYRTTRSYAKRLWPERSFNGKLGDGLNEVDSNMLMGCLPKRNLVASGNSSAGEVANLPPGTGQMTAFNSNRIDRLELMVEKLVIAVTQITTTFVNQKPAQAQIASLPEIPIRKRIFNVVKAWAVNQGDSDFEGAFHRLYTDFSDRFGIDVQLRARNRGIKPIEYIEQEGKLEELYACAVKLYGQVA